MKFILVFLLLSLCPLTALGAPFADSLLAEGDYYRAVTEYKRTLHQGPQGSEGARAALGIARAYLGAGRWLDAEEALMLVRSNFPGTREAEVAKLLYAGSAWRKGSFRLAESRYLDLLEQDQGPELHRDLRFALGWSRLELDRFESAAEAFAQNPAPGPELALEMERFETLPRKSPQLAGSLSALLPGAGQLYAGRKRSAFLAFSLNAAFLLGSIEAFENDTPVVGAILLFFELGWYGGNIYNAMNSAHKFNRDQRQQARAELRQRFGLGLLLENDLMGLALQGKF